MTSQKKYLITGIIGAILVIGVAAIGFTLNMDDQSKTKPNSIDERVLVETKIPTSFSSSEDLIKFSSNEEVIQFLKEATQYANAFPTHGGLVRLDRASTGSFVLEETLALSERESGSVSPTSPPPTAIRDLDGSLGSGEPYQDYSGTNVQVKNVDEADYVKTDGKYMYILSQNTLTIIDAYPPESSKIILKIGLDIEQQDLQNMFLNDDRLVIFYYGSGQTFGIQEYDFRPYPIYQSKTFATIIDVSDKENPETVTTYEIDGNYHNSRMIGDMVYLITNNYVDYAHPVIPRILESSRMIMPDVYHFPNPEENYNFNTITTFDFSGKLKETQTFLMGSANTIFMSENNLYITYQKNVPPKYYDTIKKDRFFSIILPLLPSSIQQEIKDILSNSQYDTYTQWNMVEEILQDTFNKMEKNAREKLYSDIQKAVDEYDSMVQSDVRRTVVHKIALDKGSLKYVENAEVPGYLLNQFSMDEHNGKFRVATTTESYTRDRTILSNNVYVLDENLKTIGKLEKIAPDESIYSARFIGDRLYLVTFQRVDPFFVIDLSSNTPKVLGELKIPGFSNYLQAYDEDHIIGIGRDTKENEWGGVQQLGVKISMFDVSNVKNPKETDTIVIGDSSIYSEILDNHKALLLDKEKNIMSIPIKGNVMEIFEDSLIKKEEYRNWNGFFVYGFDKNTFVEKGKVVHYTGEMGYNPVYMQARSLYIGDTLYTIMDGSIKMNDIDDISHEQNSILLQKTGNILKQLPVIID
ncbi:MAG TPA: beta-propeller domain-containing protein [Nitrosopumilaceae archaeon]|nr:beta-propeller domain-containing protein [Nitrosopumilaceae archaeon]